MGESGLRPTAADAPGPPPGGTLAGSSGAVSAGTQPGRMITPCATARRSPLGADVTRYVYG